MQGVVLMLLAASLLAATLVTATAPTISDEFRTPVGDEGGSVAKEASKKEVTEGIKGYPTIKKL